jgi:hypothetical protein
MATSRTTLIALALAAAVMLAGCSDTDSTSNTASASPAPTPEAAVAWANAVCTASIDLRTTVQEASAALGSGASGSPTTLEQTQAEVRDHADAVQQSAASLARTLSGVPVGSDPQLAVLNELETASRAAQAGIERLRAAAAQVADAKTTEELTAAMATLKSTLTATADGVRSYLASLHSTVGVGEQAVQESFGAAPACKEFTAAASASATASP